MCDFTKPFFKKDNSPVPFGGQFDVFLDCEYKYNILKPNHYYTIGCSGSANFYFDGTRMVRDHPDIIWKDSFCGHFNVKVIEK